METYYFVTFYPVNVVGTFPFLRLLALFPIYGVLILNNFILIQVKALSNDEKCMELFRVVGIRLGKRS